MSGFAPGSPAETHLGTAGGPDRHRPAPGTLRHRRRRPAGRPRRHHRPRRLRHRLLLGRAPRLAALGRRQLTPASTAAILTETSDARLVNAISRATHASGKQVVTEGVKNRAVANVVRGCSIKLAQSFLVARPGPIDPFAAEPRC